MIQSELEKIVEKSLPANMSGISRRHFIKMMAGAGLFAAATPTASAFSSDAKGKVVIIGGGAAGICVAARLMRYLNNPDITIIDPSDTHYYQPGFTLIASGVYKPDEVCRNQKDCIPSGVKWIKDSVVALDPDNRSISTEKNGTVKYDFLVLATGLEINWNGVEGISRETLGQGDAHCIYCHDGAIKMWEGMQKFAKSGGRGIFTDTYTKHKCGGAPKKMCLLTENNGRINGTRDKMQLDFYTASKQLYNVPFFTPRLLEIYKERNIPIHTRTRLKGIDTSAKKAYFETTTVSKVESFDADGKKTLVEKSETVAKTEDYDFMHFLPPMGAPKFVRESGLSVKEGPLVSQGWVEVDKYTMVHPRYPSIICLGDVSALPTSKTSAAIRKQAPIAAKNLVYLMEGKEPQLKYDGYAACPIVTDYGHVLMCEFDYDKKEAISFPLNFLDMSKEQWVAWLLKVYVLKPMYFYGMLNGLC